MGTKTDTWDIDDFSGGLDLRRGAFAKDQTIYRTRKNVYTGKGKELARRPPHVMMGGLLSVDTQGLLYHNGEYYTFGKYGVSNVDSGDVASFVSHLEFHAPEYTTNWELLDYGVHEGFPWAYILHQGDAGAQLFLHTWDNLVGMPTYVMDPSMPGSYTYGPDELVGQVYDPTFVPVAAAVVSKLWVSTVGGDVQCCRTADTRIWNQRTSDSFLTDGEHYVFRVPGGSGVTRTFAAPTPFADIKVEGRWAYYLLEKKNGEVWDALEETNSPFPNIGEWYAYNAGHVWSVGDVVNVVIQWGSDSPGLIRLRLVSGDTAVKIVGDLPVITATNVIGTNVFMSDVEYSYRGGAAVRVSLSASLPTLHVGLVCVGPGGADLWDVTVSGWPNGYELERRIILMKIDWSTGSLAGPNLVTFAGSVSQTIGSPIITGTGTAFLKDFKAGDDFYDPSGFLYVVLSIQTNTQLTLTTNSAASTIGTGYGKKVFTPYLYAYQNEVESTWFTAKQLDYFDQAGAEDALYLGTRNHDPTGGLPSAIGTQFNRLLVFYQKSIQLWSVDQATNATQHLANLHFGTGNQALPSPLPFYESVAVSMENTVRSVFVSGTNNDTLNDNNIGESIEGFPMPQTVASCHWTKTGQLVVAGVDGVGKTLFLVYDYSRESKISSWNEWRVVTDVSIDRLSLISDGDRLYFRSGVTINYFDAAATVFRDAGETTGNAYLSEALTHLNRMNRPNKDKQLQFYDITAEGLTSMSYEMAPSGTYGYETSGPSFDNLSFAGCSYGYARLPLRGTAPAFAVHFSSRDESGWRLRQFSLTYQYKDR